MLTEISTTCDTPETQTAAVAVVIVNYGTSELVTQCLESLQNTREECDQLKVFVVDNASVDDSAQRIQAVITERLWDEWVELICAPRNGGFAYGNNLGIQRAFKMETPRFSTVWLLNSDTIVRPGALEHLLHALEENPQAGILGSRLEDPDGTPQRSAFRFQTIGREWARGLNLGLWFRLFPKAEIAPEQVDEQGETDWLAGASMLVRREVFDDAGWLDEGYFLYYEEVDFCLRAARHNWPTLYVPSSRVVHLVGQSSGVTNRDAAQRRLPKYWFESRARYFTQNYGKLSRFCADVGWLSGHLLYRARCFVQRKPVEFPQQLLRDFMRFNFWWPSRVGSKQK